MTDTLDSRPALVLDGDVFDPIGGGALVGYGRVSTKGQNLDYQRPGDTLVVPSLDRLGRSLQDLISIVTGLRKRGIGFRSLHEALDTTTPGGRLRRRRRRPAHLSPRPRQLTRHLNFRPK
jgi:hypothetical protein